MPADAGSGRRVANAVDLVALVDVGVLVVHYRTQAASVISQVEDGSWEGALSWSIDACDGLSTGGSRRMADALRCLCLEARQGRGEAAAAPRRGELATSWGQRMARRRAIAMLKTG